ncbi:MAG: putative transcriptional regulator [Planctomycetota bacterium]|jgi:putative transcriptional regulator
MTDELLVAPGTFLAAWPDLQDPNFMHGVLFMCQHSPEGAYGLVVNRRTELTMGELMPEHPLLGELDFPVYLGGPVDHGSMQFLHRVPSLVTGGVPLTDTIFLGGELESLAQYLATSPEEARDNVRIFLGYSGWGAGQLEGELATGSWLPAPANNNAVFGAAGEDLWRQVIRSARPDGEDLENLPPDVQWN